MRNACAGDGEREKLGDDDHNGGQLERSPRFCRTHVANLSPYHCGFFLAFLSGRAIWLLAGVVVRSSSA